MTRADAKYVPGSAEVAEARPHLRPRALRVAAEEDRCVFGDLLVVDVVGEVDICHSLHACPFPTEVLLVELADRKHDAWAPARNPVPSRRTRCRPLRTCARSPYSGPNRGWRLLRRSRS